MEFKAKIKERGIRGPALNRERRWDLRGGESETRTEWRRILGTPVCLSAGVTQSGVEYIVWQRGLRILHHCHLGSNSQCWSSCQVQSKSKSVKWSLGLKYCVSSWKLVYIIMLSHSLWHIAFLLPYHGDLSFQHAKQCARLFITGLSFS